MSKKKRRFHRKQAKSEIRIPGYHHFQLDLYVKQLFGINFVFFVLISILAVFFQVLANKKVLGYLYIIAYLLVEEEIPGFLFRIGMAPNYIYSEMNGYGPFAASIIYYNLYWLTFGLLLAVLTLLFLVRGNDTGFKSRLKALKGRFTGAKPMLPPPDDEGAKGRTLLSPDADWINFEARISTAKDQTALTSGDLVRQWVEGERCYFLYRSPGKIQKYFPFISALYAVRRSQLQGIGSEVYYHAGHEYNLEMMIRAVKKSLAYYTKNFSPYQFGRVRIVEVPRTDIGAESYPGLIPCSEGFGFIAAVGKTDVEYVFKVTAHEVAHQWWGHQVNGADAFKIHHRGHV